MMKRGQILGMPLILLFGLIVAGFILAFGVRWALNLTSEADYIDLLGTIDDVESNIETFHNYDEGSSKTYELSVPDDVEKVCFYDPTATENCLDDGETCSLELQETLDLVLDSQFNVYLIPQGLYDRNRFGIQSFTVQDGNPVCVSNGKTLLITTLEDSVGISYYG